MHRAAMPLSQKKLTQVREKAEKTINLATKASKGAQIRNFVNFENWRRIDQFNV